MTSVSTNKVQKAMLVKFMEKNPDISMGITNIKYSKERWEKFAEALNSRGPPMKSWEQWNRVWINFKAKQKKKLNERRAEFMSSGVDANALLNTRLTPLESRVESIIQLNEPVDPLDQEYELIIPEEPNDTIQEEIGIKEEIQSDENGGNDFNVVSNERITALKQKCKRKTSEENKRMTLLKRQVTNQNKFYEEILARFESLDNSLKKLVALKEEEIKILKQK